MELTHQEFDKLNSIIAQEMNKIMSYTDQKVQFLELSFSKKLLLNLLDIKEKQKELKKIKFDLTNLEIKYICFLLKANLDDSVKSILENSANAVQSDDQHLLRIASELLKSIKNDDEIKSH